MTNTAEPPPLSFSTADLQAARAAWGCNCAPAALTACLGWTLDAIRPHLGSFESRRFMNPTDMQAAIESTGFAWHRADPRRFLPTHGVVRVQWGGPWLFSNVPKAAAYRYTHWVASKWIGDQVWFFDVNSGWETLKSWEGETRPRITASIKRADGSFSFTHRWEVRRRPTT